MSLGLEQLAHRHEGRRAVILGNGPSLNRTPLHLLADEYVWASNRAYLLFERIDWRPAFYVAVDPTAIRNSAAQLRECVETLPSTTFFFPAGFRGTLGLADAPNVCFIELADTGGVFADGRRTQLAASATVAVVSMQLAALLGFRRLVLTGFDMDYRNAGSRPAPGRDRAGLFTFEGGPDADHFHPGYLDPNAQWTVPEVSKMREDFRAVGEQFGKAGIEVVNATVGGALECYPRAALQAALSPTG